MRLLKKDGRVVKIDIEEIRFGVDWALKIVFKDNREQIYSVNLRDDEITKIMINKLTGQAYKNINPFLIPRPPIETSGSSPQVIPCPG